MPYVQMGLMLIANFFRKYIKKNGLNYIKISYDHCKMHITNLKILKEFKQTHI